MSDQYRSNLETEERKAFRRGPPPRYQLDGEPIFRYIHLDGDKIKGVEQ